MSGCQCLIRDWGLSISIPSILSWPQTHPAESVYPWRIWKRLDCYHNLWDYFSQWFLSLENRQLCSSS
jgi:hypothetical protein